MAMLVITKGYPMEISNHCCRISLFHVEYGRHGTLNTATLKAKSPPWTMKAALGHVPAIQIGAIFFGADGTSHRIGWWEHLQESPIFDGKHHGFL